MHPGAERPGLILVFLPGWIFLRHFKSRMGRSPGSVGKERPLMMFTDELFHLFKDSVVGVFRFQPGFRMDGRNRSDPRSLTQLPVIKPFVPREMNSFAISVEKIVIVVVCMNLVIITEKSIKPFLFRDSRCTHFSYTPLPESAGRIPRFAQQITDGDVIWLE